MTLKDFEFSALRNHKPVVRTEASLIKASVAVVLREHNGDTEALMMQRAKHERDPWSGQMSFPGGKIDTTDESSKAAAVRETFEEMGVALEEQDYIGQLDDVLGFKVDGVHAVHITPHVFELRKPAQITVNHEVSDTVWLPLSWLATPDKAYEFYSPRNENIRMPAVIINEAKEQILWGLSLRIMAMLHTVIGRPMSVLSDDELKQLSTLHMRNVTREKSDFVKNENTAQAAESERTI